MEETVDRRNKDILTRAATFVSLAGNVIIGIIVQLSYIPSDGTSEDRRSYVSLLCNIKEILKSFIIFKITLVKTGRK